MERDGDFPTQPSQGQPAGQPPMQPPPPALPWQPAPPELFGQPARPSQAGYPPMGGYGQPSGFYAPAPEQPAYMQPPMPETPGAGFGAPYPGQAPTYQEWNAGGYAPPSAPMGGYGPPIYPQPGYQPAPAQPQRKGNSGGWIAIGALGLVIVLLLLFVEPGLAISHKNGNTGSGGGGNNTQGFGSNPTNTPYGSYGSGYATDTPYPTDTPYVYPTDTPVPPPSFPFANNSVNMQMGTGYINSSPQQITGQTSDFSSGDNYAVMLNMSPNTLGVSQVNFQLWQRVTETTGNVLLSQSQPVQSSWSSVLWHDSISHLMGSEPPGQYQIYITNSSNQYLGYIDFNYHG